MSIVATTLGKLWREMTETAQAPFHEEVMDGLQLHLVLIIATAADNCIFL